MSLDHIAIDVIGKVYNEAFHHTFDNLSEAMQEHVAKFWFSIVAQEKPYLMVTEEGSARLARTVFGDRVVTDFVLSFTSTFFFRAAMTKDEMKEFVDIVANSICNTLGSAKGIADRDYAAMPPEILNRLTNLEDATKVLSTNTWQLLLVVSSMFQKYRDFFDAKPQKQTRRISASIPQPTPA